MSFLFKINGVEQEKTIRIMTILNVIQAAASWFPFIGTPSLMQPASCSATSRHNSTTPT